MPKLQVKQITVKSISMNLTIQEAQYLNNVLWNKTEEYSFSNSEHITIQAIKEQLSEILEDIQED